MAFPKLLTKLFQNDGAGSMLRTDIIPTDSSLSSTSTNAIQNKTVAAAFASAKEHADSTGYQVGDIKLYAGSNVPDGWFRCDGSTIADMATNYPKLYAVLGTNVLPNSLDMCLQGAISDIGTTVSAGLPDIVGSLAFHGSQDHDGTGGTALKSASGACEPKSLQNNYMYGSVLNYAKSYGTAEFSASRSNSIYGSSTTVQPAALKVAVLIKHD